MFRNKLVVHLHNNGFSRLNLYGLVIRQNVVFRILKGQLGYCVFAYPEIHTDGEFEAILGDYAEMGIKVIQPVQIYNDIEAAKKKYGFVCIGGWDSFGPGNLPDSTEEEVRQSVRTAMDAYGKTNRYAIYFSGCTARNPERMAILADEAEKYGHSFYKK